MRLRKPAAVVVLVAGLSVPLAGSASAAELDCGDFPTQAAAQAALAADPSDPNRLDANDNGVACENAIYPGTPQTVPGTAQTVPGTSQVAVRPVGGVAAGDGSAAGGGSLTHLVAGVAFTGAAAAAVAASRTARRGPA
ncbi:hypothetical protein GB931_00575 [Modestobacter sp. I12A-02628]|uniref:Excalibur calcium-binding domain-containing protein n=1 Tax=Goekera deserti TaxID=2497753 RepID=A0A7K3WG48_9ACTN|nr:hypothetical protein [Goekera deserti]MPQ96440.1 hypothetical protein [Goekera deserti]NDI47247.1 hypothetical protein [Goekera deserti]NEL55352.1 hypothetical protein [Goekera deserti]